MNKFINYFLILIYLSILIYASSIYQLYSYDPIKGLHVLGGFFLLLLPSVILGAFYSKRISLKPYIKRGSFILLFLLFYIVSVFVFLTITGIKRDYYSKYHFEIKNMESTERTRSWYKNSVINKGNMETSNGITTYICKDCDYLISFPEHWAVKEERFNDIEQLLILPSDFIEYKKGCRFNIANRQQQKIGEFNQIITHNGIEFSIYREPKKSSSLITETIESSFKINEISYSLLGFCTISEDLSIDEQYINLMSTIKPVVK